jgi:hypothetical protein
MKKIIYPSLVITLAISAWYLLSDSKPKVGYSENTEEEVPQVNSQQVTKELPSQNEQYEKKRKFYEEQEKDWQKHVQKINVPIKFYGKIIDEKGKPIAGAEVKYYIQQPQTMYVDSGSRASVKTNDDGRFSVSGIKGKTFLIEGIRKEEYVWVENEETGFFYSGTNHEIHIPDSSNPVVYTMIQEDNLPKLLTKRSHLSLAWDGKPVFYNLQTGKFGKDGEIKVTAWRGAITGQYNNAKFDWSITFEVPSGGIQEISKKLTHFALKEGYQNSWKFRRDSSDKFLFMLSSSNTYLGFRLKNGNYGYLSISVNSDPRSKENITIDATLNPTGGRILFDK